MKKLVSESTYMYWLRFAVMSVAFCIPLLKELVPLLLGLMFIWVLVNSRGWNWQGGALKIGLMLIYLFILLGLFLTKPENWELAMMSAEVRASYLILPLMFFLMASIPLKMLGDALDALALGTLLFMAISVAHGLYGLILHGNMEGMTYSGLAMNYHPSYMAFYSLVSAAWLMNKLKNRHYWMAPAFHMGLVLALFVFVALLASKAGIIGGIIVLLWSVMGWLSLDLGIRFPPLKSLFLLIVLLSVLLLVPAANRLGQEFGNTELQAPKDEPAVSSSGLRLVVWQASWQVLLDHPFGVGTGNTQEALIAKYQEMGETNAAESKLNSHNQFLQFGVELGWPFLILLCFLLYQVFLLAQKHREPLALLFFALLCLNLLVESMLDRQEGIVFLLFFLCLLANVKPQVKDTGSLKT